MLGVTAGIDFALFVLREIVGFDCFGDLCGGGEELLSIGVDLVTLRERCDWGAHQAEHGTPVQDGS